MTAQSRLAEPTIGQMRKAAELVFAKTNPYEMEHLIEFMDDAIYRIRDAAKAVDGQYDEWYDLLDLCREYQQELMLHIPQTFTITLSYAPYARDLLELVARCNQNANEYNSHGLLTVESLLTMLAEDAAMVTNRPGCWEAANMQTVIEAHGYTVYD